MDKHGPINVLLVDDDEDDYLIVKRLISKIPETPFQLEWISEPDQARETIEAKSHDIYLIDYRLGKVNGLQLLDGLDLFMMEQPFIILTGIRNRKIEEAATSIGISDYMVKDRLDEELLARVLRYNLQRRYSEVQRMQHLKEMNDSKDEFIALASHQLRTPATAVKQYLGILLEGYAGSLTPQQTEYLAIANESNDRQLMIINDLLKTAQLDAKRYKLNRVKTDINALLETIIADFETVVNMKEQTIEFARGKGASALVDEHEMKLALVNLIENAYKYSPHKTTIHVSTKVADKTLEISVRDEGVGIAQKDLSAIFEKFTRISNELSDTTTGNGLGLYWVKRIVQLHSGVLEVESTVGKGTNFIIKLPL